MRRLFLAAPVLLLLSACLGAAATRESSVYEPRPCWFKTPAGVSAECGTLRVREERGNPLNRRMMEIPVVRLLPDAPTPNAPPVVMLGGGGPGGEVYIKTADAIANWGVFRKNVLGGGRELIVAEQRGAGLSRPRLTCPATDVSALLARPLSRREEARILREEFSECEKVIAARAKLTAHTTAASADDFAELRRALRIPKWDLMGLSFGSRIAFELMARDPDGIRAVVMDAVVPPRRSPEAEGENVARILDALSAECAADPHCAKYGDLRNNLEAAAARLEKSPAQTRTRSPVDGETVTLALTRRRFSEMIFFALYEEQSAARLPKLAAQMARGETETDEAQFFQRRYLEFILNEGFADALYFAITCRESPRPPRLQNARFPENEINMSRLELFAACDDFFSRLPPPAPPGGDIPTLMLAGEYDVAAPAAWAREAAAQMKNARLFVFPTSHLSLHTLPCARRLTREFLQNPDAPPTECAKKTRRLTFH